MDQECAETSIRIDELNAYNEVLSAAVTTLQFAKMKQTHRAEPWQQSIIDTLDPAIECLKRVIRSQRR